MLHRADHHQVVVEHVQQEQTTAPLAMRGPVQAPNSVDQLVVQNHIEKHQSGALVDYEVALVVGACRKIGPRSSLPSAGAQRRMVAKHCALAQ